MKQSAENYKRIVVKIGSSLFYPGKELDTLRLGQIVDEISSLAQSAQKEIVIVSSGAIALGMNLLGLKSRPKDLPSLQAAAAIGQNALMDNYSSAFKKHRLNCAQVLLTWEDFDDRSRYLNAKNTLLKLLKLGVIPVINENDTVSTDEIKFGDNDRLSALVANLVNADLLVILSDVDGLLDKNKKLIPVVEEINAQVKALACPTDRKTCVGGMITKIEAAKIASGSGIPCVIANGKKQNIISDILAKDSCLGGWTLFLTKRGALAARQRWIAFGTKSKGKIIVDDGACSALKNKKSLLAVGVLASAGAFDSGDIVSITDKNHCEFARGKSALSAREIERVKGKRFDREVIHRDNIVIL